MIKQTKAFNHGKITKRITFTLDDDTFKKLNDIKKSEEEKRNDDVSLSYVIVKLLRITCNGITKD